MVVSMWTFSERRLNYHRRFLLHLFRPTSNLVNGQHRVAVVLQKNCLEHLHDVLRKMVQQHSRHDLHLWKVFRGGPAHLEISFSRTLSDFSLFLSSHDVQYPTSYAEIPSRRLEQTVCVADILRYRWNDLLLWTCFIVPRLFKVFRRDSRYGILEPFQNHPVLQERSLWNHS